MGWTWVLATLVATSMFVWVAIPVFLIMPFKPQTPLGVALSFELRQKAALVTLVGAILLFALLVRLARNATRWWQWPPIVVLAALGAGPTWFARQNHFEWMFNPLPDPTYAPATLVDFVDDRDMVGPQFRNPDRYHIMGEHGRGGLAHAFDVRLECRLHAGQCSDRIARRRGPHEQFGGRRGTHRGELPLHAPGLAIP